MAGILTHSVFRGLRAAVGPSARLVSSSRAALGGATEPIPGDSKDNPTGLGVTGTIPDEVDQSTGIERQELNELLAGVNDPFGTEDVKWGAWGTKAEPRLIPSHFDSRLVGCICDPDSEIIRFKEVHAGPATQCECGSYLKLVKADKHVTH